MRALEHSGGYVRYAWTAKVINGTSEPQRVRSFIRLFDAKQFEVETATSDGELVPANKTVTISGKSLMKAQLWEQVKTFKVALR